MSRINILLNKAIWLLHQDRATSGLDYMSRVDGEEATWYYWMKKVEGVYELKFIDLLEDGDRETSKFVLRYYPDVDEDSLDDLSLAEQILRMGDLFDDSEVVIHKEVEECACCGGGGNPYEAADPDPGDESKFLKPFRKPIRSKGIPKLLLRKDMPPGFFKIGEYEFFMAGDSLLEAKLTTQDKLVSIAVDGVSLPDAEGKEREIIVPGAYNKQFPALKYCEKFNDFVLERWLVHLGYKAVNSDKTIEQGTVVKEFNTGKSEYELSDEVNKIIIKTSFGKGDN
ncbi:MAG: hypothetical protein Q4D21_07940 [Phascolarctobacterium sp.]|nr:hypothetical protein [Phascolarctobacterium sp.]